MLHIVRTVSRFTSSGLLGKVASSTHAPRTSRRTFASTSARWADITLTVDGKEVTDLQGSALIQDYKPAGARIYDGNRLDEAEDAYWFARRRELMDMTRDLGSPHLFFTLYNLQWDCLYKQMPHIRERTKDDTLQSFFKHFLTPLLGVANFWYRYDWQGGVSVRGFLWLKDAPHLDEIHWELLKDKDATISEDQEQKMRRFVDYWDPVISASSFFARQDVLKSTKEELADLLNWVRPHAVNRFSGQLMTRALCHYPQTDHAKPQVGFYSSNRAQFVAQRNDRLLKSYAEIMRLVNIDMKPIMSKKALREYVTEYATKAETHSLASTEILERLAKPMTRLVDSNCQRRIDKSLLRGKWCHSEGETTHVLRGIPHVRCSVYFKPLYFDSDYLDSDGGHQESRLQEPEMEGVDEENPVVTDNSLVQRYMRRPRKMEKLSIYDVLTKYTWTNSEWRKNSTHVVLRVYPRHSPNPKDDHYDKYCRTKILLHHPFRNLATILKHEDQSWAELYARCRTNHEHPKDTLRCWEEESRETLEEEEDKEMGNPPSNVEDAHSQLIRSNVYTIGLRPVDDGWDLEASRGCWEHIDQMSAWIDSKKKVTFYRQDDFPNVNIDTLTQEQRKVLDMFTGAYTKILAGESPPQFLLNIDGTAGCGKTYLIRAISQELRRMARENGQRDPIRVVAPSGVAALNVSGRTIHYAFALRNTNNESQNEFVWLAGWRLTKQQLLWEGVHFVIFDEKSMLGARVLAQVDWRCRQLLPRMADKPFSNLNIALVGDFAQWPPVKDLPLYSPPSETANDSDRHGSYLYNLFKESYCLQTIHRQSGDSPEQVQFRELLRHASEGDLSEDDWRTLNSRSENRLSPAVKAQFKDAMYFFIEKGDAEAANLGHLFALKQPCALIMARHDGGSSAAKVTGGKAGRLEPFVALAKGARVMLTRNIWQESGLVNSTTGVVEDIIWAPDSTRSDLPIAVLVSYPTYTGPTLWYTEPREGFPKGIPIVPIVPLTATFEIDGRPMSRTQLPLRLAWATTLNKAQGLTLSKIKVGLGEKESLTVLHIFFALSRVKTLDSVMFVDENDLERVPKLGDSQLRDRLGDFARRYPAPVNQ